MTGEILDNLNAERRRQWDERKVNDMKIEKLARTILGRSTPGQRHAALVKHVAEARYPRALVRELLFYANVYVCYIAPHVAAILEPERRKDLFANDDLR